MNIKSFTVSSLNNYIKRSFDNDFILSNVYVKGELSNFKKHSSGHAYFSLKDEFSKINCVMFSEEVKRLKFHPKDGDGVEIKGRISLYLKEGSYQLYCNEMNLQGLGEVYLSFLKLKDKLEKLGLFNEINKKPLPKYPKKVGIITSPTGAALRDILNVTRRRNKLTNILICPALVQGQEAAKSMVKGIRKLNAIKDVEAIILARGGGSFEELNVFNDEELAYAIFESKIPIISGIGHETDFTIADFVSDFRAPTPSAAAEILIPKLEDILLYVESYKSKLDNSLKFQLYSSKTKVEALRKTLEYYNPKEYISNQYNHINMLINRCSNITEGKIKKEMDRISSLNQILNSFNPLNILNKGYSMITDSDDFIIDSVETLKNCKDIKITMKDGTVDAKLIVK
ncbi:exodeoxyribonuclease VII large subunit [Desnuesiella massiliensis]|uniref:exodeoxyribonuclease VII large subunit n=1 Tax=Desnuesiella massiliensis TaxID=1650662 RepID=UPI0006E453B8|nr:exodeoxyribonuclease VII large subunit [Desnuesiella massiliensis]